MKSTYAVLLLSGAALLGGCDSTSSPPPPVRPVLSAVAQQQTSPLYTFAGTIEPRYTANLAFRVLGRVIERDVKAGDNVKKGARLAALDPVPLDLAVKDARAGLANAEARLANALATERRRPLSLKKDMFHRSNWKRRSRQGKQPEQPIRKVDMEKRRSVSRRGLVPAGTAAHPLAAGTLRNQPDVCSRPHAVHICGKYGQRLRKRYHGPLTVQLVNLDLYAANHVRSTHPARLKSTCLTFVAGFSSQLTSCMR